MRTSLLVATLVGAALTPLSVAAQSEALPLSAEAENFLNTALDSLQSVMLGADTVPWPVVRDSAHLIAAGARTPSDTYGAINWALRRVNKHSFLQTSPPGAVSRHLNGRYGYIHIPQRGGAGIALADSLHTAVGELDSLGVCGWIVDLRVNGGGNMWPMLAGIGPLLADSVVGQFGAGTDADRWYYSGGVSGVLHSDGSVDTITSVTVDPVMVTEPLAPVAVLMDRVTASSGEALVVAFRGRPETRFFGEPTASFATINRGLRLPDGTNMVVTTGFYVDRTGVQHGEQLVPDSLIPHAPGSWPFATDRASTVAAEWLSGRPACR